MKTLLAAVALVSGLNAYAEETSTTKAKATELTTKQQAQGESDIDNQITNAKLRAESGSKSKHSSSVDMSYSGGSVKEPTGATRPDIIGGSPTDPTTSLGGSVGYRYRFSPSDSMSVGVGVKWLSPGHDLDPSRREAGIPQHEASSPSIGYRKSFKVGAFQNSLSFNYNKNTSNYLIRRTSLNQTIGVTHSAIAEIGTSGWQLGLTSAAYYDNYYTYLPGRQAEYEVAFYPVAEYVFNDTYNFRTLYRGNIYTSMRENPMAFDDAEITHSMGLGIAATRDLFFYPNIQWDWRDIRDEKTNVAVSATMNFM